MNLKVGWHDIAEIERHDVAGNEIRNVDPLCDTGADHGCLSRNALAQFLNDFFGGIFVARSEQRARYDDGQDD